MQRIARRVFLFGGGLLLERGGTADADVCCTQGWLICHRVTDHRNDCTARLEQTDLACLVRAREVGAHLADTELFARCICEALRLTREEDEGESALLQGDQCAPRLCSYIVADGDDAARVLA